MHLFAETLAECPRCKMLTCLIINAIALLVNSRVPFGLQWRGRNRLLIPASRELFLPGIVRETHGLVIKSRRLLTEIVMEMSGLS